MRGTLFLAGVDGDDLGIIPAYAGNTISSSAYPAWCQDHPRVCGEHLDPACGGRMFWGSSPRMRGTPSGIQTLGTTVRIIPAYAGNTGSTREGRNQFGDHPRVCGEHMAFRADADQTTGSSPRMRGTPHAGLLDAAHFGIIPAYAGNTKDVWIFYRNPEDHPRVCGEHAGPHGWARALVGSSPRMRGTHVERSGRAGWRGIIPAYAGNTI